MRFLSGTRNRSVTYVIVPARQITDRSGRTFVAPAIRATFKEHRFDSASEAMQSQYKEFCFFENQSRPDDDKLEPEMVQAQVEKHLMDHTDWGRGDGRGVFLDNSATLSMKETLARGGIRRCMFFQDLGEEGNVQCEQQVTDPEHDYCEEHQRLLEAVTTAQ